jgi:hypothetical protein
MLRRLKAKDRGHEANIRKLLRGGSGSSGWLTFKNLGLPRYTCADMRAVKRGGPVDDVKVT